MNIPSALPAKSYMIFQKTLLKQEFSAEFYEISIPYTTGSATEKAYSFQNQAGDTEYLVVLPDLFRGQVRPPSESYEWETELQVHCLGYLDIMEVIVSRGA